MSNKLITPTLMNAFEWMITCPDSWRDKAKRDLLRTLRREYADEPNVAFERGNRFESTLFRASYRPAEGLGGTRHFKLAVELVRGARFQVKSKSFITVGDVEYCIYGKIDALKRDVILDVKTTKEFRGESRYLNSMQHKMYCYNENIMSFVYVVAEFRGEEGDELRAVHEVNYYAEDRESLKAQIIGKIQEWEAYLEDNTEFKEAYNTKFCRQN